MRAKFREEDKGKRMEGTMDFKALASSYGSWEAPPPQSTLPVFPTGKHTPTWDLCTTLPDKLPEECSAYDYQRYILECSTASLFIRTPNQKQSNVHQKKNAYVNCHIFFLFVFSGLHLRHMEVSKLGVKWELQLPAYTSATAMPDPSHGSRQCRVLNPLSEARDRICVLMDVTAELPQELMQYFHMKEYLTAIKKRPK